MSIHNFVKPFLKEAEKSETLLINENSRIKESSGQEVYKLGFGQSPFSPPDFLVEELSRHAKEHDYLPVQGLPKLRQNIADFHSKKLNLSINPKTIFIGPGSKQLIFNIMTAFTEAEVFLVTPSWVSYEPQAKLISHPVTRIQTTYEDKWMLTPETLDKALSNRKAPHVPGLLVLNYPGNPNGITYTAKELEALAPVFRKHRILVVSDEIYGFLTFEGAHTSLATYYPEGTIITTGLSKWCGAGGWRFGIAILPQDISDDFIETLLGIASETYSSCAAPVQYAAMMAYSDSRLDTFINEQKAILRGLGYWVADTLSQAGVKVHRPEGGFYVYPDFTPFKATLVKKGIQSSRQFCEQLSQITGVALLPGTVFGEHESVLTARLAFVDFDGNKAIQALKAGKSVDAAFLETYCGKVQRGIHRLIEFVSK